MSLDATACSWRPSGPIRGLVNMQRRTSGYGSARYEETHFAMPHLLAL